MTGRMLDSKRIHRALSFEIEDVDTKIFRDNSGNLVLSDGYSGSHTLESILDNPFDQSLNITDNVVFGSITITNDGYFENDIEIAGDGYIGGKLTVEETISSVGNLVLSPNSNMVVISVGASNPSNEQLDNGEIIGWVDEDNDKLMFKVKYSDGTIKSGGIDLA